MAPVTRGEKGPPASSFEPQEKWTPSGKVGREKVSLCGTKETSQRKQGTTLLTTYLHLHQNFHYRSTNVQHHKHQQYHHSLQQTDSHHHNHENHLPFTRTKLQPTYYHNPLACPSSHIQRWTHLSRGPR